MPGRDFNGMESQVDSELGELVFDILILFETKLSICWLTFSAE